MVVNLGFLLFTQACGRRILDNSTHATNSLCALLMAWGGLVLLHENVLRYKRGNNQLKSPTLASAHESSSDVCVGYDTSFLWTRTAIITEVIALVSIAAGCLLQVPVTGVWTALGWSVALLVTDAARLVTCQG